MQPISRIQFAAAPSLETERLWLRGHCIDDFEQSAAMWADPRVTQHILERPLTKEESWSRLLRYVGHWALVGFGYWVIVEKQNGGFVGEAGFADYKREIQPSLQGVPEIGWVLASGSHNKGFATEAVKAITAWGDSRFKTPTRCIISPNNTASFHVAAKCGYREIVRTTYHGHATVMLERECKPTM
jgi:RimJ/RimL family protein N-acetyltransferase